jgi:hypothetical protein
LFLPFCRWLVLRSFFLFLPDCVCLWRCGQFLIRVFSSFSFHSLSYVSSHVFMTNNPLPPAPNSLAPSYDLARVERSRPSSSPILVRLSLSLALFPLHPPTAPPTQSLLTTTKAVWGPGGFGFLLASRPCLVWEYSMHLISSSFSLNHHQVSRSFHPPPSPQRQREEGVGPLSTGRMHTYTTRLFVVGRKSSPSFRFSNVSTQKGAPSPTLFPSYS